MKILGENANRDLYKGADSSLQLLEGFPAVLQACESAVEAQRGEMQYASGRGVPTKETIWSGAPNLQRFRFFAIEALQSVDGVIGVEQFNSEVVDGSLRYQAVIDTEFGTGTIPTEEA